MVRGLATSHRTVSLATCWQHWLETADITIVLANKINIPFSPHFERDWDFRAGARERCAWLTRVSGEDLTFLHSISGWCRHRWMGLIALHFGWRVQGGGCVTAPPTLRSVITHSQSRARLTGPDTRRVQRQQLLRHTAELRKVRPFSWLYPASISVR